MSSQPNSESKPRPFFAPGGRYRHEPEIRRRANCFAHNHNGHLAEYPFKKFRSSSWNVAMPHWFSPSATTKGEGTMKKISCVLAALATIAVAAPTVASAEGFSFRVGSDRDYYYRDR